MSIRRMFGNDNFSHVSTIHGALELSTLDLLLESRLHPVDDTLMIIDIEVRNCGHAPSCLNVDVLISSRYERPVQQ
jgi:hypothetical protein